MNPAGKTIHKLSAKLQRMIDVLHDAGQLKSRRFAALAEATGVKEKTLRNASYAGTVSERVEDALCAAAGFDPSDPSWCDTAIASKMRADIVSDYPGRDTPDAFAQMLQRVWHTGLIRYRAVGDRPTALDREVACHELSDCGQGTTKDVDLQVFLEADFGTLYDQHNDLRYGFRKARLRVDIICPYGSTTRARFAQDGARKFLNAIVAARGTRSQPSWDVSAANESDDGILQGVLSTNDEPLLSLVDHGVGTRINSVLSVNLHDARAVFGEAPETPDSNKISIIERICALQIAKDVDEQGRLDLSFHSLVISNEERR